MQRHGELSPSAQSTIFSISPHFNLIFNFSPAVTGETTLIIYKACLSTVKCVLEYFLSSVYKLRSWVSFINNLFIKRDKYIDSIISSHLN